VNESIRKPRLAIVGTTASGKSKLAMSIAEKVQDFEIVSLDSMQIYKRMDIGTAKPTREEQAIIPHHMIDIVEPHEEYTISQFQIEAQRAIDEIDSRGMLPLLVGGTGLYLRTIIDELDIPGQFLKTRQKLESNPNTAELYQKLSELDPLASTRMEPNNRRRVIRALEVTIGSGMKFSSYGPGLSVYKESAYEIIGLRWERAEIDRRITARFYVQMESGFLNECERLFDSKDPLSRSASQALGYKHLFQYIKGECCLDEAVEAAIKDTKKFARKQERWFRRDPRINWIDINDDVVESLPQILKVLGK
tara:strand:- start:6186 stop:7106 length:921 start_codon:yes stop_codon:yes gene_type:complete